MFDWFYSDLEIIGYEKKGREEAEDQEGFD
jgi:hypothetical protein